MHYQLLIDIKFIKHLFIECAQHMTAIRTTHADDASTFAAPVHRGGYGLEDIRKAKEETLSLILPQTPWSFLEAYGAL